MVLVYECIPGGNYCLLNQNVNSREFSLQTLNNSALFCVHFSMGLTCRLNFKGEKCLGFRFYTVCKTITRR